MTTITFIKNKLFVETIRIRTDEKDLPDFIINRGRLFQRNHNDKVVIAYEQRSLLIIE